MSGMKLQIFSGSSNLLLASSIANELNTPNVYGSVLGSIYHHVFPSGEHYCQYQDNIRGSDVFLVQSICNPAHERLMELLVMIDAARRASAGRITVVTPYLGYLRQDRKTKSRTPITAKLVANLITEAGADRVLGMDFHCEQAQGFFDIPVDHLYAMPVFADYLKNKGIENTIVVSPDAGGIKRANAFAQAIGTDFAFIAKKRTSDTEVEMQGIVGDVKGKNVLIIDDMTESCGTLIKAAEVCRENGAVEVRAAVSHGLLNETAYNRLANDCCLDELIMTNSVLNVGIAGKTKILSVAQLFAQAIRCIHNDESVSELFQVKGF
jgi:ribose-phosphate pyrophosphokinase